MRKKEKMSFKAPAAHTDSPLSVVQLGTQERVGGQGIGVLRWRY